MIPRGLGAEGSDSDDAGSARYAPEKEDKKRDGAAREVRGGGGGAAPAARGGDGGAARTVRGGDGGAARAARGGAGGGREVTLFVVSYLGMAYRSLPGRLLRYVIVKDPDGIYRTDYIISADTALSECASSHTQQPPAVNKYTLNKHQHQAHTRTPRCRVLSRVRHALSLSVLDMTQET